MNGITIGYNTKTNTGKTNNGHSVTIYVLTKNFCFVTNSQENTGLHIYWNLGKYKPYGYGLHITLPLREIKRKNIY